MNYSRVYYEIIENRKNNPYVGYTEKHHIVPRSLGGTDDANNLVALSAREHFICHLLLTKMYYEDTPKYYKMIKAFMMMLKCRSDNQQRIFSSKTYKFLREEFSKAQSLSQRGENNSQFGKQRSLESREKTRKTLLAKYEEKRSLKESLRKEKREKKIESLKKEIDLYREYYIIYCNEGWEKFVEKTDYKYSQPNLVNRFRKLLPEFSSQNGKRRGL